MSSTGANIESVTPRSNIESAGMALQVESTTWARDSHDLFDYETRHLTSMKFDLSRNGKVFRQGTEVSIVPEGEPYPPGGDYLLSAKYSEPKSGAGRFTIFPADRNIVDPTAQLQPKKLWLIVRDLPTSSFVLNEGDTIKLGRFKLKVKQLVKSGDALPELKLDETETPLSNISELEAKTMQCRICLLDGGPDEDPLICPCRCKGSIKFVHVDCLRHWINGRLNLTSEPARSSFFLKQLTCELCRTPFPATVNVKGERLHIVKVPSTPPPFVVLESCVSQANVNRGVHIGSLAESKDLKLGRGHDSDVRIADVSISRYHATIRFQDGNFILEDHSSKFGTLVALRKPHVIDSFGNERFSVQVGRTVLKMWVDSRPQEKEASTHSESAPDSAPGRESSSSTEKNDRPPAPNSVLYNSSSVQKGSVTADCGGVSQSNGCVMTSNSIPSVQQGYPIGLRSSTSPPFPLGSRTTQNAGWPPSVDYPSYTTRGNHMSQIISPRARIAASLTEVPSLPLHVGGQIISKPSEYVYNGVDAFQRASFPEAHPGSTDVRLFLPYS